MKTSFKVSPGGGSDFNIFSFRFFERLETRATSTSACNKDRCISKTILSTASLSTTPKPAIFLKVSFNPEPNLSRTIRNFGNLSIKGGNKNRYNNVILKSIRIMLYFFLSKFRVWFQIYSFQNSLNLLFPENAL